MPINILGSVLVNGTQGIPYIDTIKTVLPIVGGIGAVKWFFTGTVNTWERNLHGKVIIMTGATSGIGAQVADELARKGAQLILLVRPATWSWAVEFVEDMRDRTGNMLIHVEPMDLASLHSVRQFATKWLDNKPPRRLDMIICCAGVALPPGAARSATAVDGVESQLQVNYLAHYHLLTLLSPALRVQPPDRDVRVILTTCVASVMADMDLSDLEFKTRGYPARRPWMVFGASKLLLSMFAYEFQRRLNEYKRPDKAKNNVRLVLVDPGLTRTASFRRFASFGAIIGLLLYLVMWPIWWLVLKSPFNGAQTHLYAAMAPDFEETLDVQYTAQCKIRPPPPRSELHDKALQKEAFNLTEKMIKSIETRSAVARKREEMTAKATKAKDGKEETGPGGYSSSGSKLSATRIEEIVSEEKVTGSETKTSSKNRKKKNKK
jgi:NAD(P)-dependent dehydrogenase (short-subunit alcohol dehydrogenase family)